MRELAPRRRSAGLPPALTSFVGRCSELAAIDACLGGGARLVTLLGPAGAGKTRLAIEWSRRTPEPPPIWCDLTDARTVDGVCFAVAAALDVPIARGKSSGEIAEQLVEALEARGRALVVLDNFEQVLAHAPATVGYWLRCAPKVQFLVTSRAVLGLAGEMACNVGPLGLPAASFELGDPAASEAVALFLDRARSVRQGYEPAAADLQAIAEIALRLDGMPLALELAASRMRVLGPRQIASNLARRFELLCSSASELPARQATLRGAIDWSWELLEPIEQSALAQCAVFRGGFDLDAAQEVLALGEHWALDVVSALCQRSLVQPYDAPDGDGEMRYRLYESVREYAAEKLCETGELDAVERRHDARYERVAREAMAACDGGLPGESAGAALRTLVWEIENLIAVHERALMTPLDAAAAVRALTIAVALEPLWLARGPLRLGLATLERALGHSAALGHPDPALAARAALGRSHLLAELGHGDESVALTEKATAEGLQVSPSGRAFRPPCGERVNLATRGPLRRILAALADRRGCSPGEALSRDALVATGWPGERLGAEAAANRVYAAVATLRRMGLERVLLRHDDGYLLDPKVPLDRRE